MSELSARTYEMTERLYAELGGKKTDASLAKPGRSARRARGGRCRATRPIDSPASAILRERDARDCFGEARLLRDPGRPARRRPGRAEEGLPRARDARPPGSQSRTIPPPRSASRRPRRPTRSSPIRTSGAPTIASATRASAPGAPGGFQDFGDLGNFTDLFDDLFGDLFGGRRGGRRRGRGQRGADLRYNLEIELADVLDGPRAHDQDPEDAPVRDLQRLGRAPGHLAGDLRRCRGSGQVVLQQGFFRVSRPCDACAGTGEIVRARCTDCRGQGRVEGQQTLSVRIPPGVDDGTRLRLTGEGEAGIAGGPTGDLYVVIAIRPHPLFEREGPDLHCQVPITMVQARARRRDRRADARGQGEAQDSRGHAVGQGDAPARQGPADAALERARRSAAAHLRRDAVAAHRARSASCSSGSPRSPTPRCRPRTRASSTSCASCSIERSARGRAFGVRGAVARRRARRARGLRRAVPARGVARGAAGLRRRRGGARDGSGAGARGATRSFLARYPESALAARRGARARRSRAQRGPERRGEAPLCRGRAARRARRPTARASQLAAIELERGDAAAARGWLERVRLSRLERADLRNAYRVLAETATRPADRVRWLALLRAEVTDPERDRRDRRPDRPRCSAICRWPSSSSRRASSAIARPRAPCTSRSPSARSSRASPSWRATPRRRRAALAVAAALCGAARGGRSAPRARPGTRGGAVRDRAAAHVRRRDGPRAARLLVRARSARRRAAALGPVRGLRRAGAPRRAARRGNLPGRRRARRPAVRDRRARFGQRSRARRRGGARARGGSGGGRRSSGPLVSATCEAAAREAESLGVPLLALTTREEVTSRPQLGVPPAHAAGRGGRAGRGARGGARRASASRSSIPTTPTASACAACSGTRSRRAAGASSRWRRSTRRRPISATPIKQPGRLHAARRGGEGAARDARRHARARAPPPDRGRRASCARRRAASRRATAGRSRRSSTSMRCSSPRRTRTWC